MFRNALVSALLLFSTSTASWAATKNILVFVVDDMGLTAGCYGDSFAKTPNLDRLAAQGTRFTHAFCTTASCSASRSVILTGQHNHATGQYGLAHGNHNFKSKANVVSLPARLSKAGYRTASIGKYHVEPRSVYPFDEYPKPRGGDRSPAGLAEAARRFIEQDKERPFFLYVCTSDPHRAARGFGNDRAYPGEKPATFDPNKLKTPPFLPDRSDVREELAEYYQAVARADQALGAVLDTLAASGRDRDTLVLFLSDNGIPFPGAKTTHYDPGIRLPLVVRMPGHDRPGSTCEAMVAWTDITPTLLEWAGIEPAPELHGRSFLSIVGQTSPAGWDEVFASHTFHEVTMYYPMRTVRTRRYKYIHNLAHPLEFPIAEDLFASATWQSTLKRGDKQYGMRSLAAYLHRPEHELYDLKEDPHETVNLADEPASAAILADLQQKLRQYQTRTGDPWIVKYRHE